MIKVTDDNLKEHLNTQNFTGVIKFAATWCGPCQQIKPVYETISKEYSENVFVDADVDENSELTEKFEIMRVPTIVFVSNGQEVGRIIGTFQKKEFVDNLNKIK